MENVEIVLAGHGEPVTDPVMLIDERFRLHARRAAKIRRLIRDDGPATAYEVAQSLWGNVAVTQAYLTLSEVLGHVDLLVTDGQVVEQRATAAWSDSPPPADRPGPGYLYRCW
jgi:hypothetical protein